MITIPRTLHTAGGTYTDYGSEKANRREVTKEMARERASIKDKFRVEAMLENGRTIYILKGDKSLKKIPVGYFENLDMFESDSEEQDDPTNENVFRVGTMKKMNSDGQITQIQGIKGNGRKSKNIIEIYKELRNNFFKEYPQYRNITINRVDLSECHKLKSIENEAFKYSLIESIKLPESIEELGSGVFWGCPNLRSIDLSGCPKLKRLPSVLFIESGIERFTLPPDIEWIGPSAFSRCKRLKTADLSRYSKLEIMYSRVFSGSGLISVKLSSSINEIYSGAFSFCENLETVDLSDCANLSIDGNAFEGSKIKHLILSKHLFGNKTEEERNLAFKKWFGYLADRIKLTYAGNASSNADVTCVDIYNLSFSSSPPPSECSESSNTQTAPKEDCM